MKGHQEGPKCSPSEHTSVYKYLEGKTIINGRGATTAVGGTLMVPAAVEAMVAASKGFVVLDDLNEAVGRRIAEVTGAEAGYVTSGSAAGMVLGAAACITGDSAELIKKLPNTFGIANEIIIQREHRLQYDQMYRIAGGSLVEVGGVNGTNQEDLESAVGPNTVAIAYHDSPACDGPGLEFPACQEVAKRHGLPIIVDAASTLPPVNHLNRWIAQGADLVIYSGGKGIRGPQNSGLLAGRKDLIQAARMNGSPRAAVGRGMKVSKEAMAGLWAAIDDFVSRDHKAEYEFHYMQAKTIEHVLFDQRNSRCEIEADWESWPAPVVRVFPIDKAWSPTAVRERLVDGDPPIHINVELDGLMINTHCLHQGEELIVVDRLRQHLDPFKSLSAPTKIG